jgi:hypothetical protein
VTVPPLEKRAFGHCFRFSALWIKLNDPEQYGRARRDETAGLSAEWGIKPVPPFV